MHVYSGALGPQSLLHVHACTYTYQVRSDRNLYAKNQIEAQEEIAEMKRKFKTMTRHIEQLKEEIDAKDQAFVKEHIEHNKADKEKDALKNNLVRER